MYAQIPQPGPILERARGFEIPHVICAAHVRQEGGQLQWRRRRSPPSARVVRPCFPLGGALVCRE